MPLPIRHLPVVQNWDCHGCGRCCHEYQINVTEEERRRIEGQGWAGEPGFDGVPLFVRQGPWWSRRYRLNHRENQACVFLNEKGLCRIHERFGSAAKPLACRLYPFMLIPADDHWQIGLRFACPSATSSLGRPLAAHQDDLKDYAARLQEQTGIDLDRVRPPRLQAGQRVDWPDFFRFVKAFQSLLRDRDDRVERRLRKCLFLAGLCRQARFDAVKGPRLVEFLNVVGSSLDAEVPADPASLPPPTWIGRVLFRQAAALYMRKDHGLDRGIGAGGRGGLFRAALQFIRGTGPVPKLHRRVPDTTFEHAEQPTGPLPEAVEQMLERYYAVKVASFQFCGPTNFGLHLWAGMESLALTFPVILWLSRVFADLPREEAVALAVSVVDNNFGFNRLLGTLRQRVGFNILARRGELEKLIAWYSR